MMEEDEKVQKRLNKNKKDKLKKYVPIFNPNADMKTEDLVKFVQAFNCPPLNETDFNQWVKKEQIDEAGNAYKNMFKLYNKFGAINLGTLILDCLIKIEVNE